MAKIKIDIAQILVAIQTFCKPKITIDQKLRQELVKLNISCKGWLAQKLVAIPVFDV